MRDVPASPTGLHGRPRAITRRLPIRLSCRRLGLWLLLVVVVVVSGLLARVGPPAPSNRSAPSTTLSDARAAGTVYAAYDGLNRPQWQSPRSNGASPLAT